MNGTTKQNTTTECFSSFVFFVVRILSLWFCFIVNYHNKIEVKKQVVIVVEIYEMKWREKSISPGIIQPLSAADWRKLFFSQFFLIFRYNVETIFNSSFTCVPTSWMWSLSALLCMWRATASPEIHSQSAPNQALLVPLYLSPLMNKWNNKQT